MLVHGMVVAGRSLIPLATELARQGFAVWVPDLPGFGGSERPRRALGVNGLADALAAWTASLELPPGCLVGNSFGIQVATALVHRHPGVARRLALVAPTIDARLRLRAPPRLRARHDSQEQLAAAPDSSFRKVLRRVLIPPEPFSPEATPPLQTPDPERVCPRRPRSGAEHLPVGTGGQPESPDAGCHRSGARRQGRRGQARVLRLGRPAGLRRDSGTVHRDRRSGSRR